MKSLIHPENIPIKQQKLLGSRAVVLPGAQGLCRDEEGLLTGEGLLYLEIFLQLLTWISGKCRAIFAMTGRQAAIRPFKRLLEFVRRNRAGEPGPSLSG